MEDFSQNTQHATHNFLKLACFSRLRFRRHRLQSVVKIGRARLLPSQNGSDWRVANGE